MGVTKIDVNSSVVGGSQSVCISVFKFPITYLLIITLYTARIYVVCALHLSSVTYIGFGILNIMLQFQNYSSQPAV